MLPRANIGAPKDVVAVTLDVEITSQEYNGIYPNCFWVGAQGDVTVTLLSDEQVILPQATPGHWHALQFKQINGASGAVLAGFS